jgi:hypothetical protein
LKVFSQVGQQQWIIPDWLDVDDDGELEDEFEEAPLVPSPIS